MEEPQFRKFEVGVLLAYNYAAQQFGCSRVHRTITEAWRTYSAHLRGAVSPCSWVSLSRAARWSGSCSLCDGEELLLAGLLDHGENPIDGAIRELEEETGFKGTPMPENSPAVQMLNSLSKCPFAHASDLFSGQQFASSFIFFECRIGKEIFVVLDVRPDFSFDKAGFLSFYR